MSDAGVRDHRSSVRRSWRPVAALETRWRWRWRRRWRWHWLWKTRARDIGLGSALLVWNFFWTTYVHPVTGHRVWPYDPPETFVLPVLGIWVVLVGRRACPELAIVACAVLELLLRGTDATSDPMTTACAAFAVMQSRHGWRRVVPMGLTVAIFLASVPLAGRSLVGLMVALSFIVAGSALGCLTDRRETAAVQARRATVLRLRAAEQAVALTVAHERQMIAREMHDVLSHGVAVMVRLSEAARLLGDEGDDDRRRDALLTEISAAGRGAITDMRRLLRVDAAASPAAGLEPTLSGSLRALGRRARLAGLPVELEVDEHLITLCSTVSRRLIARAVQEGLTNAFRYADGATCVLVRVRRAGDESGSDSSAELVVVEVLDDGRGASVPLQGTLSGLIGLDEGVRAVGGCLEAGPRDDLAGRGWRLTMTIPEGDIPRTARTSVDDEKFPERYEIP
jgi:signal transduction histidine kinase